MASRRRRFRTRPKPQPKKPPSNEELLQTYKEIRLIASDGEQLGVMSTKEAIDRAAAEESDIVIVAEKADPPVARILDLGKHMYEKRKKQAKQRKMSKSGNIKGVRIGFKTGEHDWNLRLNQASRFLDDGNKVKLEIRLRGREKGRMPQAEEKLHEFIQQMPGGARVEGNVGKSPRGLTVVLTR